MLKAYEKGLLHPGYPQGLMSHFRERLILQSIADEYATESMQQRVALMCSLFGVLKPDAREAHLTATQDLLTEARRTAIMHRETVRRGGLPDDLFVKLFEGLKKSGMIKSVPPAQV